MNVRRLLVSVVALIATLASLKAAVVVVVENGKIVSVGTDIPKGASVIDLGDRTLLPGFIDCHVHPVGRVIGAGENWDDAAVCDLPEEDALRGVRNAKATLPASFPHGKNAHEFELMVGLGMTPMDAILAGTNNAAQLLGLEKTLGTVEAGKIADLVTADGNPLDGVKTLTPPAKLLG